MELELKRIAGSDKATVGTLSIGEGVSKYVHCFTIEDEFRAVKVAGQTRIPSGRYEICLRKAGGMHDKYSKLYPWHIGMLHLQDVPNFTWIYIHTGNTDEDTEGCILPNYKADLENMCGESSFPAYKELYLEISLAIRSEEQVFITITDEGF